MGVAFSGGGYSDGWVTAETMAYLLGLTMSDFRRIDEIAGIPGLNGRYLPTEVEMWLRRLRPDQLVAIREAFSQAAIES